MNRSQMTNLNLELNVVQCRLSTPSSMLLKEGSSINLVPNVFLGAIVVPNINCVDFIPNVKNVFLNGPRVRPDLH